MYIVCIVCCMFVVCGSVAIALHVYVYSVWQSVYHRCSVDSVWQMHFDLKVCRVCAVFKCCAVFKSVAC